jgi:DNA primase
MEAKEEIRSRLNIEDVIGQYVQLKRAGRNFKGISPFSHEKTASFMVSPEKHIWHDFSSGKGGDVFSFVMEVEGIDFKTAIEMLARRAGVDLSQFRSAGDGSLAKKKDRLFAACDLAAKYYQQSLLKNKTALEYVFKKRRLSKQVVQDFRIGYSPNTDHALMSALLKREFTERELHDAGLVVSRRNGPGDMFRGRMMVPLMDPQGRVVGFTARQIVDDPNGPKYINTQQTILYDKSRHVFGLHLAKEAIRQNNFVVIVEGQLDAVSSHQAGVNNVVATAGTAITEHHLRSLSRFTQDVRLAFDADKAGIAATERAISLASNLGMSLGIIHLPKGVKDADELVQKDVGLWQKAISQPQDAVSWLLDEYAVRYDLASAYGKRLATDLALGVIRPINDPVLSEHYMGLIGERVGVSLTALIAKLGLQAAPATAERKPVVAGISGQADSAQYQDHLLALALAHPQLRDSLSKLEPQELTGADRQAIATHLKTGSPLLQSDEVRVKMGELELIAEAKYPAVSDELYFMAADIVKRIKKEHKQRLRAELARQFVASTSATERTSLNNQIKQLNQDIEALKH